MLYLDIFKDFNHVNLLDEHWYNIFNNPHRAGNTLASLEAGLNQITTNKIFVFGYFEKLIDWSEFDHISQENLDKIGKIRIKKNTIQRLENLSRFKSLYRLEIENVHEYFSILNDISSASLKDLHLENCMDVEVSLNNLLNLEKLYISNVTNQKYWFNGPHDLLKELTLHTCKFTDYSFLSKMKSLEKLTIILPNSMNNLYDIELPETLKTLYIDGFKGNIDFSENWKCIEDIRLDCKSITSLKKLDNLVALKYFVFNNAEILDADLSPLNERKWEYIYFKNRKNYSHKLKDIPLTKKGYETNKAISDSIKSLK